MGAGACRPVPAHKYQIGSPTNHTGGFIIRVLVSESLMCKLKPQAHRTHPWCVQTSLALVSFIHSRLTVVQSLLRCWGEDSCDFQ